MVAPTSCSSTAPGRTDPLSEVISVAAPAPTQSLWLPRRGRGALRQVLDSEGPTIVAGYFYGGQIMTALGTKSTQRRRARLRRGIRARQGESLERCSRRGRSPALAHLFTDARGFGWLSEEDFVEHFAADVDGPAPG